MKIKELINYEEKSKVKAGDAILNGKYPFFTSSETEDKRYDQYTCDAEGIIMGTGGNATLHYYNGKFAVSTDCLVLKTNQNVKCKYLYYFFKANMEVLQDGFKGAGLKHTNKNYIENIELSRLPDIKEQLTVIERLDRINNIIQKHKKVINHLDVLIKARFVEMFGEPVINSKKWETSKLKECSTKIGSGATPRGGKEVYIKDGISLIRSLNVHNNSFIYNDLAHINSMQAEELDNVTIENDDILLNITGASVARCCIVPVDALPARVNQHVCIIRLNKGINSVFLNYQITSNSMQKLLIELASAGATREAITKIMLKI